MPATFGHWSQVNGAVQAWAIGENVRRDTNLP